MKPAPSITVLFVCVHNSGRSQMAEAFFNHLAAGRYLAASAGTQPTPRINATVARVMAEVGIDLQDHKPRLLTREMADSAQRVITTGCGAAAACPALLIPGEDWGLADPEGMAEADVRKLRDDIKERVAALIRRLDGI